MPKVRSIPRPVYGHGSEPQSVIETNDNRVLKIEPTSNKGDPTDPVALDLNGKPYCLRESWTSCF